MAQGEMMQLVQAVVDDALPLERAVGCLVTPSAPGPTAPSLELLHRNEIGLLLQLAVARRCPVWLAVRGGGIIRLLHFRKPLA